MPRKWQFDDTKLSVLLKEHISQSGLLIKDSSKINTLLKDMAHFSMIWSSWKGRRYTSSKTWFFTHWSRRDVAFLGSQGKSDRTNYQGSLLSWLDSSSQMTWDLCPSQGSRRLPFFLGVGLVITLGLGRVLNWVRRPCLLLFGTTSYFHQFWKWGEG